MESMMQDVMHDAMRDMHFDGSLFLSLLLKVAIACALTLPISVERYRDDRSAGLRTFPIVAAASCGFVLLAGQVFGLASEQQTHILQGLVTGIGFIGGGAIVKEANRVRGTATAAAVWSTGIVGAAVGYGRLEIALVVGAFTAVTLGVVSRYEMRHDAAAAVIEPAPGVTGATGDARTPPASPGVGGLGTRRP
jgi:putative Mg2+ transporter-C (MgtC) family protein